jgi:hypothetical protein
LINGILREESGVFSKGMRDVDLSSIVSVVDETAHRVASALRNELGVEIDDERWRAMNVPSRLRNRFIAALRIEMASFAQEWKEDRWKGVPVRPDGRKD